MVAIILLSILNSFAYRWRGMNENVVPKILKNRQVRRLLCSSVIAAAVYIVSPSIWVLAIIPLSIYGIIVGHGSYMSFLQQNTVDNEIFAPITKLNSNPLSKVGKFIGMSLTGLLVIFPIVIFPILVPFSTYSIPIWYILVSFVKPILYYIFTVNKFSFLPNELSGTQAAERLWGLIIILPLLLV